MCYGDDARPPYPPVSGGAHDHGDLVLRSSDGTELDAFSARSDSHTENGMVILPDVRGLHTFYKDLTIRFGEAGMHAISFDYFARTAGRTPRDESFEYKPHVEALTWDQVAADTTAAVTWLRGIGVENVFTVGFCLGGAMSWRQSAETPGLSGCIGFYGIPSRVDDVVERMQAPLLILAAGEDFTPLEQVEAFAGRVRAAGIDVEMHVYEHAPHSFFDRTFDRYAAECDDAWRRILGFVDRRSASVP